MQTILKTNFKKYDKFFLRKDGKIDIQNFKLRIKYEAETYIYNTIKKNLNVCNVYFPDLLPKNYINSEELNINKILFYIYLKKIKNLYYIDNPFNNNIKLFFYKNNIDYAIKTIFLRNIYDDKIKIKDNNTKNKFNIYISRNIFFIFSLIFLTYYISYKPKYIDENNIFVKMFYKNYIFEIRSEIKLLYNVDYKNFSNYKDLYNFLNKKGYVKRYYNEIVPNVKKMYKRILYTIENSNAYKKLKNMIIKKIKPVSKIDINKIIDERYTNKDENKYIKNKLKKMKK